MKKLFTKLFSASLIMALALTSLAAKAQTSGTTTDTAAKPVVAVTAIKAQEDTTWKPQRRLWGYAFGDEYFDAHADKGNRGPENMYNGVPTYRNAFQFRRIYLGYDYEITKKFKAEVLLASEPNANTGAASGTSIQNGDNLVDSKMAFWIKNFNIRARDIWAGTDFVIGELSTPGFALNEPGTNGPVSLSESTWGYRSIEKTITDVHKNNSYDVGAALQGTFDPKTKNYGYVLMVSDNSTSNLLNASNPNTGFYKIIYGDLWGKFFNQHLYADVYVHTAKTGPASAALGAESNTMYKLFVAYLSKPFNMGVEAYTQTFVNGVTNTTTKTASDATVNGLSIWFRGAISPKWNYFAKWDNYNPFTDYDSAASYSVNSNIGYGAYNPSAKENFYTAGLDYNPTKNVHFMPNFWLLDFKDQRASSTTGYVGPDHTLVYRFTFYYTFGK
ncbi:MAG TPA: hypothetical protein VIM16_20210 [Mucilaginibacter sp.]|jgi:hypothetical protein